MIVNVIVNVVVVVARTGFVHVHVHVHDHGLAHAHATRAVSFCDRSGILRARDISPSRGKEPVERSMCMRLCEDKAFCEELNPDTNDCATFSTEKNAPKICGFRG